MFNVYMVAGKVKKLMYSFETEKQAEECCDFYGWEVAPDGDGGFVWDLEIREEEHGYDRL